MNDPKTLLQRYEPKRVGKPIDLTRQVCMLRYSPDGKFLAAAGFDAQVSRWLVESEPMTPLPALTGHNGWVQTLAFHPDSNRLFTADTWGRLCCWPVAEKEAKPLWQLPQAHDGWIRRLAVSPDGKTVASCGRDGAVRLWTSDKGEKVREWLDHKDDVFSLVFHPDGKTLLSGDLHGIIRQWDLAAGKMQRTFDAKSMYLYERIQEVGGVRCLTFGREGTLLLAGGSKPKSGGFVEATPLILAFDWTTGLVKHTLTPGTERDGFVLDLAWHADGFMMAVTSGQPGSGKLLFARPEDAQPFFTAPGMANCHSLAVHPAGRRLIVAGTNANSAGNGRVKGKEIDYPGNFSPLHVWEMPKAGA